MNRLYVVEPTPSVTGSSADHRLPLRYFEIAQFARALAAKLGLGGNGSPPPAAGKWLDAAGKDLQKAGRKSLVVAGEQPPPGGHAFADARKPEVGSDGHTAFYTQPGESD